MKATKRSLLTSGLCLLLSASLLTGATFAWFTDSMTNEGNTIQAGTLDVDLYYRALTEETDYKIIDDDKSDAGLIFTKNVLWEPGYANGRDLRVVNHGSLALKWQLYFTDVASQGGQNGVQLENVLDVYVGEAEDNATENMTKVGTLAEVKARGGFVTGDELLASQEKELSVVLKMQKEAGNSYQGMSVSMGVQLRATQLAKEMDGFGNSDYDATADGTPDNGWSSVISGSQTAVKDGTGDVVMNDVQGVAVTLPGTLANGTYILSVTPTGVPAGVETGGKSAVAYAVGLEGLAVDNDISLPVEMYVGPERANIKLYHNTDAVQDAVYDPATGYITFSTRSFGVFTVTWSEPLEGADIVDALKDPSVSQVTITGDIDMNDPVFDDASGNDTFEIPDGKTLDLGGNCFIRPGKGSGDGMSFNQGVTATVKNGTLYNESDMTLVDVEYGANVTFEDVNFVGHGSEAIRVRANGNGEKATVVFQNCTFDNAPVVLKGMNGSSFVDVKFVNCDFHGTYKMYDAEGNALTDPYGHVHYTNYLINTGSSNYICGEVSFQDCTLDFDAAEYRYGEDVLEIRGGNRGDGHLAVTLNNVTITGKNVTPVSVDNRDKNYVTIVEKGDNSYTVDGREVNYDGSAK